MLVENWGHEALTAESGDQALEIARQEQPNVILMDIVMPGMSGFQTTRKLTRDQATHDIPVIFVSNRNGEADRVWGMRQGATAYVTKPVNPDLLLTAISDAVAA
jgi:twitching motility two-component system response regulator PilH